MNDTGSMESKLQLYSGAGGNPGFAQQTGVCRGGHVEPSLGALSRRDGVLCWLSATIFRRPFDLFPVTLALVCAVVTLCACGFHPRGSLISASDIGSIFVDAEPDLSVAEEVREALLDSSFLLAPDRNAASILLRLNGESQTDRVISVTSDGSVSELELTHGINMLVARSQDGEPPVYQQGQVSNRIEVAREYTYDETGVLGKENEARILRDEMKRDIVRQIILRAIASLAPSVTS